MRIGQVNQDNYKEFLGLLETMNRMGGKGKKVKKVPIQFNGETLMLDPNSYLAKHIDKNGRMINSEGMEGMDISGGVNFRRLVPISEHMAEHAIEEVKKNFYEHGGMTGDNMAEADAYYQKIKDYLWTVDVDDRSAAAWTINQVHASAAEAVVQAVRERVPDWDWGKPIDSKILDGIFADETITSKFTEGFDVTSSRKIDFKA